MSAGDETRVAGSLSLHRWTGIEPKLRQPTGDRGPEGRTPADAFLPGASTDIPLPRSAAWLQAATGSGRLEAAAGPTAAHLQCAAAIPPSGAGAAPSVFGRQLELDSLGDRLWAAPLYTQATPCVDGEGFVYVGSVDGTVCRLDGSTGEKVKEFKAPSKILGSSLVLGKHDEVCFCSSDGTLQALDRHSFEPLWQRKFDCYEGREARTTPVVADDGTIFFLGPDLHLYALDGRTGQDRWPSQDIWPDRDGYPPSFPDWAPALGDDGTVFAPGPKGGVMAFDAATGERRWTYDRGYGWRGTPVVGQNGLVYSGGGSRYDLLALDAATGEEKWTFQAEGFVGNAITVGDDGTVYLGGDNMGIHALDGDTGKLKWFKKLEGRGIEKPLFDRKTLYVHMGAGVTPNHLYALDTDRDGEVLAQVPFGGFAAILSAPAMGLKGQVYFGNQDGYLHAIQGRPPERDLAKAASEISQVSAGPAPTLEIGEGFIIVAGVRVPVRD